MRMSDDFISKILDRAGISSGQILDVGCGYGFRTIQIAKKAGRLAVRAIDSDEEKISIAQQINSRSNINYRVASASALPYEKNTFDAILFFLSFHHVAQKKLALVEALRVLKKEGKIIFVEPEFSGSMLEAEMYFDCMDGDERKQKALAYYTLLGFKGMQEISEYHGQTTWIFEDTVDFINILHPKRHTEEIPEFLHKNKNTLFAKRRINIFCKR